jgi:hypothetical protein
VPKEQRKMFDKHIGDPAKHAYKAYQADRKAKKEEQRRASE